MSFPPTLRDSADESIFGDDCIDIHVDPNSLPAPPVAPFLAINDNISDEEEEEEEIEEDPIEEDPAEDSAEDPAEEEEEEEIEEDPVEDPVEEDPAEDPAEETPVEDPEQDMDATPGEPARPVSDDEPMEAVPSFYARGNSRSGAMRTARMRVRFPSYDYASTSRAHAPHHSPTPSVTPSPTPGRVAPPTPTSPIGYTPSSEPSSPAPLSPYSLPYSPNTQHGIPHSPTAEPRSPSHPSSPARETPSSTPNQSLPASPHSPRSAPSHLPTLGASTSAASLPQPSADPRVAQLMGRAANFHLRITQLEENVEILPGPAQLEDMSHEVQDMDERLNLAEHRVYQLNERVLARGALVDQVQRMDAQIQELLARERRMTEQLRVMDMREGADRVEIHNLRRRLRILEDRSGGYM